MSTLVAELPDLYEVVNGQVVELKNMSVKSTLCATDLSWYVNLFARPRKLGMASTETLIAMPDRFEHNRRPDMIYVSKEKWPLDKARPDDNAWDVVPDICVEVVSPSDHANEIRTKVREYFTAGVPLVWVVYPDDETVDVYTAAHTHHTLTRSDTLTAGSIIPGFELPLAQLFLPA